MAEYDPVRDVITISLSEMAASIENAKPDEEKWIFNWSDQPDGSNARSLVHPDIVRRIGMQTGEPYAISAPNGGNALIYEGMLGFGVIPEPTFVFIGKVTKELDDSKIIEWYFREMVALHPSKARSEEWWKEVKDIPQEKYRVDGNKLQELVEDAIDRFHNGSSWNKLLE